MELVTPRMGRPYSVRGQGVALATHAAPGCGLPQTQQKTVYAL